MIPEELLERFRTLSLERIGRVEAMWNGLVQNIGADEAARQLNRDVHTLKGDAAIVGFFEVQILCQKLEDLLQLAAEMHYEISEDFELVVTMAIQFVGMLLRKKRGSAMTGLDLPGFVRQVDDVLRESRALPMSSRGDGRRTGGRSAPPESLRDRVSEVTRQRLATAATSAFLEYLSARGVGSRSRLRSVWTTLKQELVRMQFTELAPLLEYHAQGAAELASGVGKRLSLQLERSNECVDPRVAEAIDVAVVHVMRNAVDHGIEPPDVRAAAGKRENGMLRVRVAETSGAIEISIEDDGRGIDLPAVRAKGVARGLLPAERAADATDAELIELVFQPGFSTKASVTDLSGRGVGMDAVRSALARVGGSVRLKTKQGTGTTVTLTVPAPLRHIPVYHFLAPGGAVALAVLARWTPSVDPVPPADAIDPLHTIQLFGSSRQTSVQPPVQVRDLGVRLRWGFLEVSLRSATEPSLVTAERICPTADDYPVEIISVDGQETLMLRPEHISELAAAWAGRSTAIH
ncbi:MAG TPA: ATP-binding protein [Kofleriaceae bacterium]|nr:ATP-binding protein [Kofleriaceae bacterium]